MATMDTSYLTSQVATIIAQLHGLFDEIGLFTALSESLHNHLRQVAAEKDGMTEEARRMILTIKQMEASLDGTKADGSRNDGDPELSISYPLTRCLQSLKQKQSTIAKIHKERFEQVRKLVQALESYSSHLEPSFIRIALPPKSSDASISTTFDLSSKYVTAVDNEFTRVYEEYTRRVNTVQTMSAEIIKLWAELGTPQVQTDASIVKNYRDSPEQLGLHEDDLKRLAQKKEKLVQEKRDREQRLRDLKSVVGELWDRLGIAEQDRKMFLNSNRGCGLKMINEFEEELGRLKELKRQNLHLFVEDARYKLQDLWDSLYFSEEEMLEFTPAFSDVYSDALLSSHEAEIARLEALKEQRAPILQLIEKYRSLVKDRNDLAASSQDASRLMTRGQKGERRDPTRLLREEKLRKRIAKELPKVEADLKKTLEGWEEQYGRPFCIRGERYLDELISSSGQNLPPRSKTPSVAPPSIRSTRSIPTGQRPASVLQGGPSRSGTKTPTGTIRRNPLASSTSTMGGRSPSKIPARVPLGTMPYGNNSPERVGGVNVRDMAYASRKLAAPTMAPPPKMRDLFAPDPATILATTSENGTRRCDSVTSSDGSVRHLPPEDVYDDAAQLSYLHSSTMHSQRSTQHLHGSSLDRNGPPKPNSSYPQALGSRQISTTSSATNTVSGSENWETYDDGSEPEADASEAYYAKLRAARGKRFTPDSGYAGPRAGQGKKSKGIRGPESHPMAQMEGEGGRMIAVSGSDAGWTDEDAF